MVKSRITIDIPKFDTNFRNTNLNLLKTAKRAETIAKNSIVNNSRNGTTWPNLPFTSSGKSKSPASQSGALARSIVSGATSNSSKKTVWIGVNGRIKSDRFSNGKKTGKKVAVSNYWAAQEFGSRTANLPERPYLRPALQQAFKNYKAQPEEYFDVKKTRRTFRN